MIGAVDPSVLVTVIGAPAALITAIGTVILIGRKSAAMPSLPDQRPPAEAATGIYPGPAQRYVTQEDFRAVVDDIREDMHRMEERQDAKLDLILRTLLKDQTK